MNHLVLCIWGNMHYLVEPLITSLGLTNEWPAMPLHAMQGIRSMHHLFHLSPIIFPCNGSSTNFPLTSLVSTIHITRWLSLSGLLQCYITLTLAFSCWRAWEGSTRGKILPRLSSLSPSLNLPPQAKLRANPVPHPSPRMSCILPVFP
jgi:hypothetical protein